MKTIINTFCNDLKYELVSTSSQLNEPVSITVEIIKANIWGKQKTVYLTTWEEIKKLGFQVRQRSFGNLNDNTQALFFCRYENDSKELTWYLTTETLEQIS